jgi:hypothetical protein
MPQMLQREPRRHPAPLHQRQAHHPPHCHAVPNSTVLSNAVTFEDTNGVPHFRTNVVTGANFHRRSANADAHVQSNSNTGQWRRRHSHQRGYFFMAKSLATKATNMERLPTAATDLGTWKDRYCWMSMTEIPPSYFHRSTFIPNSPSVFIQTKYTLLWRANLWQ